MTAFETDLSAVEQTTQAIDNWLQTRPTNVITGEIALLERLDRGELPCPCCNQPLAGEVIDDDPYFGVALYCPTLSGCGFREL